jgi:hypothetical protein
VKNRLSDAVFAAARTAKRVLAPVTHPLTLTALLTTLGPSFAQQNANAEVLLTMGAQDIMKQSARIVEPNGTIVKVLVYADNTSQDQETSGIKFKIAYPSDLAFLGKGKLDPYYTNSQADGQTNDFFYPLPMDLSSNAFANLNLPNAESYRFTAKQNIGGELIRQGPAKKRGWLGSFYFKCNRGTPYGKKTFKIYNALAYGPKGEPQEARGTEMSILVVPDNNVIFEKPTLIIDNNKIPYVFTEFDCLDYKDLVLEASDNLADWIHLQTRHGPGRLSFEYRDTNVAYHPNRFYRAVLK